MSDSPSHQAAAGTVEEKGKRLAQMIAMGFGYFKGKQALEEHDWNVEEAIASVATTEGTAATTETSPRPSQSYENAHTNVSSLKHDTPHSKQHFNAAAVSKSGDSQHQHLESLSSKAAASARQQDAHTTDNAPDEEAPELGIKNMEANIQKRENDTFWNEQELLAPSGTASTPSAYYYIQDNDDDEESNTWTAAVESKSTDRVRSVPSFVNTSSGEPSIISGVTYPVEIATHFPGTETPEVQDLEDKSAVKKSYGQQPHCLKRRRIWVIALAILIIAFLGLAVGLGVTQSRSASTNESGESGGDLAPSTTPPPSTTIESTRPPTGQESPTTRAPLSTQLPSALRPTTLSTELPTTVPPVTTNVPLVTTSSPALRPTEPPTEPPTDTPTEATTESPTEPPTEPPRPVTKEPTPSPTEAPTEPPMSTMEPIPPPPDSMSVEAAELVLYGISSRLDLDALGAWANVTIGFIGDYLEEVLPRPYGYNVDVEVTSQMENDDELSIIFSVEFDIESSLESHNVKDYVRKALSGDDKDAYIQALQDKDSSFRDVYDVEISV